MPERKLQRVSFVIIKSEYFDTVRKLLEENDVEFFVNDPILRLTTIGGFLLLKE